MTAFSGRKVAVLGGGGFIGTHLCNALSAAGAQVVALGRSRVDPEAADSRVSWSACDIRDGALVARQLAGADLVFHLVSSTTPATAEADPAGDLADNVVPSIRLMQLALELGVRRLVFASSGGTVYGVPRVLPIPEGAPTEPISAHGLHKLAVERYLALFRRRGLDSVTLRIANLYGPLQRPRRAQGVVAAFLEAALRGKPLEIWGDGTVVRDFIFIDDLIEAMLAAACVEGPLRVFNVGSGEGRDVSSVARDIEAVLGRGPLKRVHHDARAADVPINVLDISRIRTEIGWTPRTPWLEGLRRTAAWMQQTLPSSTEHP